MILKYISIPELNFYTSWSIGWNKIQKLSKFDKLMTLFWFLGPFIYLIERDPADLWLTLIGLIFLTRCIIKKDWGWTSQIWFKLALSLWVLGFCSSLVSPDPFYSISKGFVWIRFPLYAAAAQVWLGRDRDIRIILLMSILVGMIIMSFILLTEMIIEPKLRLTWPYGDHIPGAYIAKFSLPIICVLTVLIIANFRKNIILSFILITSFVACLLTGERVSFLIIISASFLSAFCTKYNLFKIIGGFSSILLLLYAISFLYPSTQKRFTTEFLKSIPIFNMTTKIDNSKHNPYWGVWRSGIHQGFMKPVIGIGPSNTRNFCKSLPSSEPIWLPGSNHCGNHPHNFYIQLFAETGVIGLFIGFSMFLSIILTCYKSSKLLNNCPMAQTAFIIPLAFFFPLQQFGNFYGQWGNLFIWFAIGFALSQFQDWERSKSNFAK